MIGGVLKIILDETVGGWLFKDKDLGHAQHGLMARDRRSCTETIAVLKLHTLFIFRGAARLAARIEMVQTGA